MALQTSGAISLSDIQGEFGGTNPTSLSEYYSAATGIPASGAISLSDFYGATSAVDPLFVDDPFQVLAASSSSGQNAVFVSGRLEINPIGTVVAISDGTNGESSQIIGSLNGNGTIDGNNVEVRLDHVSGAQLDLPANQGVWQTLSTVRTYSITISGTQAEATGQFTLRTRNVGDTTDDDSTSVTISCIIFNGGGDF